MPLKRSSTAPVPPSSISDIDVLKALRSSNPEERWVAARAASTIPGSVACLAEVLPNENDPRIREAMLTSLASIGSAESIDAIVPLLRNDNANLRAGALDALRAMADHVRARLPTLLADDDSDVRVLSCEIARCLPNEEATQILCDLLSIEEEPNVTAAAIDVLAEVGTTEALSVLAQCEKRFQTTPFLLFATKIATDRIRSKRAADSADPHD